MYVYISLRFRYNGYIRILPSHEFSLHFLSVVDSAREVVFLTIVVALIVNTIYGKDILILSRKYFFL